MTQSTSQSSLINDTELEKVSDVVSNATFYTMASSCKTNGQKNTMLTLEYLYYTRKKGVIRRFFGGNTAEGTNVKDSDIDKMIVASNITACKDRDQSNKIEGQVFILDTSVCRPGFARLIPVKLDPNIKTIFNDHGKTIDDMLETIEGDKTFLSSDKMVDFWMYFLTKTKTADTPTETSRHGPSATAGNIDIYGFIKEKLGASVEQDFAFGISLYQWPIDGEEWIARERKHGWPSPEFIEKITKLKCHVVAVGDKISPTSSLEWRVSFLLQERELVWNFNDTQLQCFILMKNILKKFLHPIAPEELSSYHMKTIILWQSENNPQHLWQPKYLLRCTVNCLLFLKYCIEKRHLEHYINRRKNLFSYRFENHIFKENMIKCIEDISADIVSHVLQCVDGVDLLSPWLYTAQDVIFSREDISFVPHALKFECTIGRAYSIHPLVYMLYLAVISTGCDQEAYMYMDALDSTVNECEGTFHSFRHLNILGYCYLYNGDLKKAFECYTKSLMQTVTTGRQNVALIHLIILMFRVIKDRYGEECIYKRQ